MWLSGGDRGGPSQADFERWRRRMTMPENEIPAAVGVAAVLGRTPDVAVGITCVEAFSTGWRFGLAVRVRTVLPGLARGELFMLVSGHGHHGDEVPLDERLLVGVEYADGRRTSILDHPFMAGPGSMPDDDELVLTQQGGGGGELSVDHTFWVSPLPPDGPVVLVVAWPGFGIAETRTELDGAALRAAGARSTVLWPPQPPWEPPGPPTAPPRPSSGWFAAPPD